MKEYLIQGSSVLAGVAAGALLMTGAAPVVAQMAPTPTPTPVPTPSPTPTPTPPLSGPSAPATTSAAPATPECATAGENCSLVEQDGTGLQATIVQTGSGNISDVDQIDGSRATVVEVTQSGTNARSYVLQSNSDTPGFPARALITQSGDSAESIVIQSQARNSLARVTQEGDNESFVSQVALGGPPFNGGNGSAVVEQGGGDNNESVVMQLGHRGFGTTVEQEGNFNTSGVFQGDFTASAATNGQRNSVSQTGDRNDSFVSQTIFQTGNANVEIDVEQTGDDNIASVVQTGTRVGHDAAVIQSGNDNLARVVQDDTDNTGGGNQVMIDQTNDGNDAFVDQTSGQGLVEITQISDDTSGTVTGVSRDREFLSGSDTVRANFAFVQQRFGGVTEATIFQDGFGNRALVNQGNIALDPSDANINQYGTDNNSESLQDGDGTINVDQGTMGADANRNSSLVDQSGFGNLADVDQTGDDNLSDIIQNAGSADNQALVTQAGNFDASLIDQSGSNNIATVTQGTP